MTDDWEYIIAKFFEDAGEDFNQNEPFSSTEIYKRAIVKNDFLANNIPKHEQTRIGEILRKLGFVNVRPRVGGTRPSLWVKS